MSDVCFYSKLSLSLGSASQVSSVVEAYASNPTEVSFHLGVGLAQGMDVPPETLSVIAVRTPDVYREVPIVCSDLVPQTSTRRLEETPEWRELQSSSSTLVIDFGVILSAEVANETGATAEGAGHIPLPNVTLFEQTMGDAFTNLNITVEILEVVQETPVLVGYSTTRTTTSMAAIEEDTSLVLILGMSATILIVSAVLISLRWQYLQQYAQLQETQPPLDTAQVDEKAEQEEEVMNSIDTTASPSTVVGVTPVQVTGDPPLEKVYEELEISV